MPAMPTDETAASRSGTTRIIWIALGCAIALIAGLQQLHARNLSSAQYGRAVSRAAAGRTDEAITEMRKAVQLQSNNVLAQALLGDWLLEQNDPGAAISPLEHALQLEPDATAIEQNLALAYLGAGKPLQAINEISRAVTQDKEQQWKQHYIQGVAADELGYTQAALQNLRAAIQLHPDFAEAQLALARVNATPGEKPASDPIPYAKLIVKSEAWPYYP
jgi:predicted Zn-dependent protease